MPRSLKRRALTGALYLLALACAGWIPFGLSDPAFVGQLGSPKSLHRGTNAQKLALTGLTAGYQFTVTDATSATGDASAGGFWAPNGTHGGKPEYRRPSGDSGDRLYWDSGHWLVLLAGTGYAWSAQDVAFPWQVSGGGWTLGTP